MTRGLFPKRIIRYAGLTEPPMCTSAYLANVGPDIISSRYWFRSKKCSEALSRVVLLGHWDTGILMILGIRKSGSDECATP